jgi:hypothetical protein
VFRKYQCKAEDRENEECAQLKILAAVQKMIPYPEVLRYRHGE